MHLDKCADYLAGKQNRTSFRSRPPMRWKALLELVHTDVCYVDTKSHSGGQYFVTFIDDNSRKLWAYVLKTKDQVLTLPSCINTQVHLDSNQGEQHQLWIL